MNKTEININDMNKAIEVFNAGGIVAYPTEGVWGLGCDPFNQAAVEKLLAIKNRDIKKGLILIASNWQDVAKLITPLPEETLENIRLTWPGPITWTFPASDETPYWITGGHDSVAIRLTNHPIAKALCEAFSGPLVSTSANESTQPAITDEATLQKTLGDKIDFIVTGNLGNLKGPTPIFDARTGASLR